MEKVFITGGTGYIGRRLMMRLLARNHAVTAVVRKGSEKKLPPGCKIIVANPLDANSFRDYVPAGSVFVQLLGVAHPSPDKAALFRKIDLESVKQSAEAAKYAGVAHFIYISVAMEPSSFMQHYQQVRQEGEAICLSTGLPCTFIRPWYVTGPGHWWPLLLLPFYAIAKLVPPLRKKALAFGLVSIRQMLKAIIKAVEAKAKPLLII